MQDSRDLIPPGTVPLMKMHFDPSAIASDLPRTRKQFIIRAIIKSVISILGINHANALTAEIAQAVRPVAKIRTRYGDLLCVAGHGRLLWRANTFHTEEPETVEWLNSIKGGDILWDVGANIGLYAIYAAKFRRCKAIAFEPESQNYALLAENIVLNGVQDKCSAACFAISGYTGLGDLCVPYITKGGAYNSFEDKGESIRSRRASPRLVKHEKDQKPIRQMTFGVSLDDLIFEYHLETPTHIKIDVDGLEPHIMSGAKELLALDRVGSILIEIDKKSPEALRILGFLKGYGFEVVSERSNWESRGNRDLERLFPTTNIIFRRKSFLDVRAERK